MKLNLVNPLINYKSNKLIVSKFPNSNSTYVKIYALKTRVSFVDKITEILSQKKKLLTEIYFELQLHFEKKYGKDALVLMEIGTFFEVYEVNNDDLKVGKAKEIAELLNIQLTRKSKAILEKLFYTKQNY
ncbi:MAG: DNA mismatch repair protein MutS [uncultured Sulfurovum sp.]|uniref:DNA mismatch repair protein MutS n=1 Tax=uncultured Sulfurovum sp. TaxID=269237 RepID=A0A6S6TJD4_9BACT|nr:MAG: DNA mismatch repair protein MutS [uncultured Sulfurovum sp.]